MQILRLITPKLKTTLGAPFAQDDSPVVRSELSQQRVHEGFGGEFEQIAHLFSDADEADG
jgi:hypothetical protein